jgi:hypothetical protein
MSLQATTPQRSALGRAHHPVRALPETLHTLRCVSSGYLTAGCSCHMSVPATIVTTAWERALERMPAREDGFFNFTWHGGEWLAYGLRDGRVRGVYCPSHSAQRAMRAHALPTDRGARAAS